MKRKEQRIAQIGKKARIYDRRQFKSEAVDGKDVFKPTVFKTTDGHAFGVHGSGAFVRLDKDRRPVKERKRSRREARKAATTVLGA